MYIYIYIIIGNLALSEPISVYVNKYIPKIPSLSQREKIGLG